MNIYLKEFLKTWPLISGGMFLVVMALVALVLLGITFVTWDTSCIYSALRHPDFPAVVRGILALSVFTGGLLALGPMSVADDSKE